MDIYEVLYTTRAMRRLKPDPIPYEAQARILDAAIRAPHIGEGWRFILVDDPEIKSQLAPLYRQGFERMIGGRPEELFAEVIQTDTQMGKTVRSGLHLVNHFADVPLLLMGFGRTRDGAGVYPALWSAMLAARAEGIGSTLTGFLQSYFASEVMEILQVPKDAGWYLHGVVVMGYPSGRWGVGARKPVHEVAARNSWEGDLGFAVPEALWRK
ncbi:MAG TPA: nitroreductase family protein [Anaerolineales bacterium]|jgi:nitroreductase|nr:nitroreductase family protein [Anaerolineales bacterium]